MELLDSMRSFMTLVTAVVLVLLVTRYLRLRKVLPRTIRLSMMGMFLFLVTLGWDTIVLMDTNAPFSWRLLPFAVGLAMCIAALAEPIDVTKRHVGLDRDVAIKSMQLELAELGDRLYDTLRRENIASTKLLIVQSELERSEEARRVRDAS